MFTPRRIPVHELLDEHDAPREEMERSLRDLRWINNYAGGIRIYRSLVRKFAPDSIVDLGTGTSDLLESVPQVRMRIGLDFKIEHLLYLNDTRRHYAPLLFVLLLGALRFFGEITRYDAPASVRQGYTLAEARAIARRVGQRWTVVRKWPYRMAILLWK